MWERKPIKEPLWGQQQAETEQAFAAFVVYRDMGETRGHAKVARQLKKSVQLINRWSARWSWSIRARAWDAELDKQKLEAIAKARAEMTERHIKHAKALQFKAIERLAEMEPGELKPSEALDFFVQASKIERLAFGEPTDRTAHVGDDSSPPMRWKQIKEMDDSELDGEILRLQAEVAGTPAGEASAAAAG